MKEKEKATFAAPSTEYKDNKNICIRATIKALFRSGKKFTARKINQLTRSNDARKRISELRREGWDIRDVRQRMVVSSTGWLRMIDKGCWTFRDNDHEKYR